MKIDIIAEIAQGYEGKMSIAKKLIKAAKIACANSIKFQMVYADELATKDYKFYRLFKKLELTKENWKELKELSKKNNLNFYVDIFGEKSLKISEFIKADGIKIHPTDLNNFNFLKKVSFSKFKKIFLGIGGANLDEIQNAINILKYKSPILLFGFQSYPTPLNTNEIYRILNFYKRYKFKLGFADHSIPGSLEQYIPSILSIGSGSCFLEKHLTLKTKKKLEDSESAYYPKDFKVYSNIIKISANCMGKSISNANNFYMSKDEKNYAKNIRRSIVTSKDLMKNTKITHKCITLKRTSIKYPLNNINQVLGKRINKFIQKNTPILKKDLY